MSKEKNIQIRPFNASHVVEIKEPGSVREGSGYATMKITCSVEQLRELRDEATEVLERFDSERVVRDSETLDDGV